MSNVYFIDFLKAQPKRMKPTPVRSMVAKSLLSLLNDLKFIISDETVATNFNENKNKEMQLPSGITIDKNTYSRLRHFGFLNDEIQNRITEIERFIYIRQNWKNFASRRKKIKQESETDSLQIYEPVKLNNDDKSESQLQKPKTRKRKKKSESSQQFSSDPIGSTNVEEIFTSQVRRGKRKKESDLLVNVFTSSSKQDTLAKPACNNMEQDMPSSSHFQSSMKGKRSK